jgi:hypothetical protein
VEVGLDRGYIVEVGLGDTYLRHNRPEVLDAECIPLQHVPLKEAGHEEPKDVRMVNGCPAT